MSQEKLETMLMQNFEGQTKREYHGILEIWEAHLNDIWVFSKMPWSACS